MNRSRRLLIGSISALLLLVGTCAFAQQRIIRLNGSFLTQQQAYQLDNLVGTYVPNGGYWLDVRTGVWGYEGSRVPQGQLNVRGRDTQRGTNIRTPFGDIMSDGRCTFVAGVPAGNCD